MGCDKVKLEEETVVKCPLCNDTIERCDDCGDYATVNEDWWCYSEGDMHYCDNCWQEHLRSKK